ncbi:MAG TPA: hypothetical protein VGD40_01880 [Chryseosolibacter sp.]
MNLFKQKIAAHAKNVLGWHTSRKIVVLSFDDYGNVRLASAGARRALDLLGFPAVSNFDRFDSLETRQDLELLFDSLSTVTDKNGRHAVVTPFALPCNLNFEAMKKTGYQEFIYELLPETFAKLPGYERTWDTWKEGMQRKIFMPQFHGREHLNLPLLKENLRLRDPATIASLEHKSYTSLESKYPTISYTAAFDFIDPVQLRDHESTIVDGLNAFEKVFGMRARHFNPPGGREHPQLHKVLHDHGIRYLDAPSLKREHRGFGKYRSGLYYTGKRNKLGQYFIVRNVVFEPTSSTIDWVAYAMMQITASFYWRKPAVVSSHRVNFAGNISERHRDHGIRQLRQLLAKITQRWPDVEFMAADELGDIIVKEQSSQ